MRKVLLRTSEEEIARGAEETRGNGLEHNRGEGALHSSPRVATLRALLVGAAAVTALSVVSVQCTLKLNGSLHSWDFVLETAIFLLLVVLFLNGLVGLIWRRVALGRGELAVVFMMLLAAAPVPTIGFMSRLIPALGGLNYYADSQPQWREVVLPYVPKWLAPQDELAVKQLFEGLPRTASIPWAAWAKPLSFWGAFFMALSLLSICLAVILRKQWVERERLAYPIMGLALGLLDADRHPGERPLWRNLMLWVGVAVAFGFSSLHPIHRYLETWTGWSFDPPRMDYYWRSENRMYVLRFKISWAILGLTYLIPQDVALSVWFFNLLYQLQASTYRLLGFDVRQVLEPHVWNGPCLNGQVVGAFLFLGASALWMARRHIAAVWRAACSAARDQEEDEIISYRFACWGFISAFLALLVMLCLMGTPVWLAVVMLLGGVCFFIAITKIAIQCGLGWIDIPIPLSSLVVMSVGTTNLSAPALASLGTNWIWTEPMRLTVMGTVSHGLKVSDQVRAHRGVMWAILFAILVALVAGTAFQLHLAYHSGGINFYSWFYGNPGYASRPWRFVIMKSAAAAHGPKWEDIAYMGMGAGIAGLLQYLRHRYIWWPFSVVGYAGALLPTTSKYWFDVFLVWLLKGQLLRYGGQRLYRFFKPFFLGLLMGHAIACGIWYLVAVAAGLPYGSVPW